LIVRKIHTIFGGLASWGESTSARNAHARSVRIEKVYKVERPPKFYRKDPMIISFSKKDAEGVLLPYDDALVVTMTVANHTIHRILVDNGSSAEILYWSVVQQMGITQDRIKPFGSPMVGFMGEQVQMMGLISLSVMCINSPRQSKVMVDFLVVDQPSAYNMIIGQPALNKLKAITLTYHLMMKFPMKEGIGELRRDQVVARKCYNVSLKKVIKPGFLPVSIVNSALEVEIKDELVENLEEVVVGDGKIGSLLTRKLREGVVSFLHKNMEVFPWIHEDILEIDPEDIAHCLNTNPEVSLVKQKRSKFASE
jgi:hypothetical protein